MLFTSVIKLFQIIFRTQFSTAQWPYKNHRNALHIFTHILLVVFCIKGNPPAGFNLLFSSKTNATYLSRLCNGCVWYWHAITIVLHGTNFSCATDTIIISHYIRFKIVCVSCISYRQDVDVCRCGLSDGCNCELIHDCKRSYVALSWCAVQINVLIQQNNTIFVWMTHQIVCLAKT